MMTRLRVHQYLSSAVVCGLAVLGTLLLLGESRPGAVAGPVLLAATTDDRIGLRSQLLWIFAAAVVGGGLGYGIATLAVPTATTIALGFGIAAGGGLGAVARLLAIGETESRQLDTVTVSSTTDDTSVPDPQPVDLFEENPDPVLFFDDSGNGPVVRAANPAFEERFGVNSEAVEDAALADALMTSDRADDITTAVNQAESVNEVVRCETPTGERPYRVRTVAVARGSATRGYVLYTAVENAA